MSKKTILITIAALFTVNVWGQTLDATYLNPKSISSEYKFLRFGESSNYYAGFMYNISNASYGNGDDFSIFTYGNRDLTFRTGTGNVIFFPSSGGKVGIGTTSPSYKLEVKAASDNTATIVSRDAAGGIASFMYVNSNGSGGFYARSSDNSTNTVTINGEGNSYFNGGNVGIGTTNPYYKLTVQTDDNTVGFAHQINGSTKFYSYINSENGELRLNNSTGNGKVKLNSNGNSYFNGGNVGIGTTNPYETLELKKDGQVNLLLWDNTAVNGSTQANINFWGSSATYNSLNPTAQIKFLRSESGALGNIAFSTRSDGSVLKEAMRILSNGNVGIGTTEPGTYKLAVDGTIGCEEVKVEIINGADLVFEDDYKLRELNELEEFVKREKHLPEIASEKEMLENGVDMGEFQIQLLQKIEELTLYVIELKKENDELKEKVEGILTK